MANPFNNTIQNGSDNTINLTNVDEPIQLLSKSTYFQEKKGWGRQPDAFGTLDSIINGKHELEFKEIEQDYINLGLTNSYYWFKLTFENSGQSSVRRYIKVESQELVDIKMFFIIDNKVIDYASGGRMVPVKEREYYSVNHIFPVDFPPNSFVTIYISIYSPLVLWMTLHTTESLTAEEYIEVILITLFYGIFIAVFMYNAFLSVTLKDRSYAYYLGHIFCMGIFFFVTNGFISLFFPGLNSISAPLILISVTASAVFYLLFITSFLETKKTMPKLHKLLIFLIPCFLFASISWNIFTLHNSVMYIIQPLGTLFMLLVISTSLYAVWKGYRPARMLLYGTVFYQSGAIITGLVYTGRIPLSFISFHALQFGFAFEMLLLSFALADKMKKIKHDKEVAEKREIMLHQKFSENILKSQQEERKKIAGTLHDSIGQDLLIVKNWVEISLDKLKKGMQPYNYLEEILKVSKNSIEQIRNIARSLYPYQLEQFGLKTALEMLIKTLSRSGNMKVDTHLEDVDSLINHEAKLYIYSIVQEAFNNILKHSKSTTVILSLKVEKNDCPGDKNKSCLLLEVVDNGIGFDVSGVLQRNPENLGLGLHGMYERARILNANLDIDSQINKGTRIRFMIPVKSQ